jgi:hypothetical protein
MNKSIRWLAPFIPLLSMETQAEFEDGRGQGGLEPA